MSPPVRGSFGAIDLLATEVSFLIRTVAQLFFRSERVKGHEPMPPMATCEIANSKPFNPRNSMSDSLLDVKVLNRDPLHLIDCHIRFGALLLRSTMNDAATEVQLY